MSDANETPPAEEVSSSELTPEQIGELEPYARLRTVSGGETLFAAGDTDAAFYVVEEGEIEVCDDSQGKRQVIARHGPREFTGDMAVLLGRPAVFTAVTRGETTVHEIAPDALRRLVSDHPELGNRILEAFLARREWVEDAGRGGVTVIGSRYSPDTLRVRDFLSKNQVAFTWIDVENDRRMERLIRRFRVQPEEMPIVTLRGQGIYKNPSNRQLGRLLNITQPVNRTVYDLLVVGGGPAGLAAAVYGASEGLKTAVIEANAPGGQAGASSNIENYLGFPQGLSGSELADRAVIQAQKFGATITAPVQAVGMSLQPGYTTVRLDSGERAVGRCVLIATGASYRRLPAQNCENFEGRGVYYSATVVEAQLCVRQPVVVVGGGNSAGQAAVFLAESAGKVVLVYVEETLEQNMSSYLATRIDKTQNIEQRPQSEVILVDGVDQIESVVVRDNRTGEEERLPAAALFVFIGAEPHTAWLPEEIETDEAGFILTGPEVANSSKWPLSRQPFYLETSCPGIFAAGDVRAGSVKRVAAAVGEGSMAIHFVHQVLAG